VTRAGLDRALRRGLGLVLAILLGGIAAICFVEVILRYVFLASLAWYDEFVGYLLVWLTFLGAVDAQAHGNHIGIANLVESMPERLRKAAMLSSHAVLVGIHLVLLLYGAQLAFRFLDENAVTLPVPMGVIYSVIPVSAALMLMVEGIQIASLLRRSEP
jgi:TRAP-type C4-dicarboxylate transport system permease small subunit